MKADGTLYREGSYVVHGYDDILPQDRSATIHNSIFAIM